MAGVEILAHGHREQHEDDVIHLVRARVRVRARARARVRVRARVRARIRARVGLGVGFDECAAALERPVWADVDGAIEADA